MQGIRNSPLLDLKVVVTGSHLSPEFGMTWTELALDGFQIDNQVEMLLSSDSPTGISKSIAIGLIGLADVFSNLTPDLILVLGDRFEILSAVIAALPSRVPVAHIHGGEITTGAFDDAVRHAITKMSHLHFVAAEEYRQRVIQMGEDPARVHCVGGLGVDAITKVPLLERRELEEDLGLKLLPRSILVTFHPATLDPEPSTAQFSEVLRALETLEQTTLIFTMPNADTTSRALMAMVTSFVAGHPNAYSFNSLGQQRYLSCLRHVDVIMGNSSSGILEAPTLRTPTINIGDRQKGRLKASSIIDCSPDKEAIEAALAKAYSPRFQEGLSAAVNPYGAGGAAEAIVGILEHVHLEGIVQKEFYDWDWTRPR
jgi:GDP/UDP-N,N'-diacetylbacillosamine 2-epimerase (hydrolysing)